jgi:hypothetical protein
VRSEASVIDWPLAIVLTVVFLVASVARWRYFRSLARRRRTSSREAGSEGER